MVFVVFGFETLTEENPPGPYWPVGGTKVFLVLLVLLVLLVFGKGGGWSLGGS